MRSRDRGVGGAARLRLIVGAVAFLLYFAYLAAGVYQRVVLEKTWSAVGWDANYSDGRWVVTSVGEGDEASGLRAGDELLAHEGEPVRQFFIRDWLRDRAPAPGTPYTVTVRRDGETRDVHLQTRPVSRRGWGQLLFGLVFYLTGLVIFLLKPFDKQALLLALTLCMMSIMGMPDFRGPVWMLWLFVVTRAASLSFMVATLFHFFLVFPEPSPLLRRFPRFEWALYLPVTLTALPFQSTLSHRLAFAPEPLAALFSKSPWYAWLSLAAILVTMAYILAGLVSLVVNYLRANRAGKRKLRIVMIGSLAGFLPILLAIGAEVVGLGRISPRLWGALQILLVVGLPLMPLSFVYAIARHKVIPIHIIIRRGVRYLLVSRGFILVQSAIIFVVLGFVLGGERARVIDGFGKRADVFAALVAGGLAGLVAWRINRRVMPWIDRRFFRESYDTRQILSELGRAVLVVTSVEQLLGLVAGKIQDALHPETVAVFLRDEATGEYVCAISSTHAGPDPSRPSVQMQGPQENSPALPRDAFVVESLRETGEPLEVDFNDPESETRRRQLAPDAETNESRRREAEVLARARAELLLPVATKEQMLGVVVLGERLADLPYSREDRQMLMAVALQMAFAIENARLIERKVEEERLRREVEMATEVQRRIFPEKPPDVSSLDLYGSCQPARGVGGDYYDFIVLEDGKVGVAVADVAGKGISAALLMSIVQASLRSQAEGANGHLTELVSSMNRLLNRSTGSASYATFFYAQFDPERSEMTYVNAGHNPPILVRAAQAQRGAEQAEEIASQGLQAGVGRRSESSVALAQLDSGGPPLTAAHVEMLKTGGPVIGLFESFTYDQETVRVQTGDVLVAYTDGLSEALNPEGEEFGEERLLRVVTEYARLSAGELSARIADAVRDWCRDAPQHDDLTLVVAKVR